MFSFFHRSQISYRVVILWELQPFYSCAVIFDGSRHLRMKKQGSFCGVPSPAKKFSFLGLSVVSGAVFVWNLPNAYAIILLSKEILGGLRHLARALKLELIVEGVETREQVNGLLALGCRYAQGFFYGRPEPAENFLKPL